MPSFKHKTNKKIFVDKKRIMTLDSVHRELQSEFNLINSDVLPTLIRKKNEIMKKLNNPETIVDLFLIILKIKKKLQMGQAKLLSLIPSLKLMINHLMKTP